MEKVTSQNPSSIRDMFGAIAGRYDLANSVLSFGIHHLWKKRLIRESDVKPTDRVLDCASGTGDLAFLFEKKMAPSNSSGQVLGTDFCEPMLQVAKQRAQHQGSHVQFEVADVMALPYSTASFSIASISFGIRNVQNPETALRELGRVVKPGGRVLVLEFGQPYSRVMQKLFNFYSHKILPWLGGWLSGQPQAYKYLQTSSSQFPCGKDFVKIAEKNPTLFRNPRNSVSTGNSLSLRHEKITLGNRLKLRVLAFFLKATSIPI